MSEDITERHDHIVDEGIRRHVEVLQEAGIETFESCEGTLGHAFNEPTVQFHGSVSEGYRAVAVAMQNGLKPYELSRVWSLCENELVGPEWRLTFTP